MEPKKEETFQFTYSAKQQEEIKSIRKKYVPPEEDKMEQLRRLDASATKKATTRSIAVGIIGALILGCGMSLVMSELPELLGLDPTAAMFLGIAVGLAGMVLIACAYPLYNHTLKKERARIAPEILRLTDELMQ